MFKKLLAVAVALVLMICTASVAYADNDFTLTVEKVKAKAGDTVEVDITVSNNPGIWAAEFSVRYDTTSLTLTEITNGDIFGDNANAEEGGFIGNTDTSDAEVSFMNEGIEDVTGNGVLCTLKFKVNSDADAAVYDINIIATVDSFFDVDAISYQPILNTGNITVDNGTAVVTNSMPVTTATTAAQTSSAVSDSTDKNSTSAADNTDTSVDTTSTDSTTAADNTDVAETTSISAVEITTSANDDNDSSNTALYIVVAIVIAAVVVGAVLIIMKQRKPAVEKETPSETEEDKE